MARAIFIAIASLAGSAFLYVGGALTFQVSVGAHQLGRGLCVEDGMRRRGVLPVSKEEVGGSYFHFTELARSTALIAPYLPWPRCAASLRGDHRYWARLLDVDLKRLREPVLRDLHETHPEVRSVRILAKDAHSRLPIVFQAATDGRAGTVRAAWLEDDGVVLDANADWDQRTAWFSSPLPVGRSERAISASQVDALMALAKGTQPDRRRYGWADLDGWRSDMELADGGQRRVLTNESSGVPEVLCAFLEFGLVPDEELQRADLDRSCE